MAVAALPAEVSRWVRVARSLSPAEWRRAAGLAFVIVALHVVGFGLLLGFVAPQHLRLGSGIFGIGVGITAYTLGMRHAFDADHIGAIDNTTRKLMSDGQRPLSVGFFFSLGHSSVVFLLAIGLSLGIKGLSGSVANDDSALHQATGLIGPTVSGTFLFLIGILNLMVLIGIVRVFLRMRHGEFNEQQLEEHLNSRGFMNRFLGRATRAVKKPWQMYPLGLLFGLGFDTATEIALLATAGTAAAGGLPIYAILCLPILFAAGMTLLDTIDGAFMNFAYGWAFSRPVRKVFYNITITALSVAVALIVGTVELLAVFADRLHLSGGIWDFVSNLDLNLVGYFIVALFVGTWIIALAVWRFGRIEERWSARLEPGLETTGSAQQLTP
jgi:high-affinity nickel-transport protein